VAAHAKTAIRTDEALWRRIVRDVTADDKGGRVGQWSARKAQIAVARYKAEGGGYIGPKSTDNALSKWSREHWQTKSGKPSLETGERYLPKAAIDALTDEEYKETSRVKRKGMREGRQFVSQPLDIAAKTAKYRQSNTGDNMRRNNPLLNIFTQFILVDAGKGNEAVVDGQPHDRYTLICLNPQSSGRSTYYSYLGFGPGVDEHGEFTEADFEKLKAERYKSLGKPISIADLPQKLQGVAQRFMQSCVKSGQVGRSSNPIDMDWGDDDGYDDAVAKIGEARKLAVQANRDVKELLKKKRTVRGSINSPAVRQLFFAIMAEAGTAKLLAEDYAILADIVDDYSKIDEARELHRYAAEVEEEHMGY
jgi:hypothetical protein